MARGRLAISEKVVVAKLSINVEIGCRELCQDIFKKRWQLNMSSFYKHNQPVSKYTHITKEFLQSERDAGKTVKQIAEDNNIPSGTVSTLLQKYKISKKRGV